MYIRNPINLFSPFTVEGNVFPLNCLHPITDLTNAPPKVVSSFSTVVRGSQPCSVFSCNVTDSEKNKTGKNMKDTEKSNSEDKKINKKRRAQQY